MRARFSRAQYMASSCLLSDNCGLVGGSFFFFAVSQRGQPVASWSDVGKRRYDKLVYAPVAPHCRARSLDHEAGSLTMLRGATVCRVERKRRCVEDATSATRPAAGGAPPFHTGACTVAGRVRSGHLVCDHGFFCLESQSDRATRHYAGEKKLHQVRDIHRAR